MDEREREEDGQQNINTNSTWTAFKVGFSKVIDYTDRLFDIENQRFVVGLNSAIVAAAITASYRARQLALVPRVLLPPICGITAAVSWEYLITRKLATKELDCPACTDIRGLTIAITTAAILPLCVGGLIIARRSSGLFAKAERFTENFSDNLMQRPILVAAVLAQGGAGWIMANREFEKRLVKELYSDSCDG